VVYIQFATSQTESDRRVLFWPCSAYPVFGLFFQLEQCFSLTTIQSKQCFSANFSKDLDNERGCLHHVAMHAPVHNRLPTLPSKFNSHGVCYIHINQLKTICNLLLVFVLVSPTRYTQSRPVNGEELSLSKFGVKLSSGKASIDRSLRFTQICFTSPTLLRAASIRALPASFFFV